MDGNEHVLLESFTSPRHGIAPRHEWSNKSYRALRRKKSLSNNVGFVNGDGRNATCVWVECELLLDENFSSSLFYVLLFVFSIEKGSLKTSRSNETTVH